MKKLRKLKKKEDKFMKIEKYFGNYECNNFNKVVEYMTNLNENLKNVYNFEFPFFKGNYERNFGEYLKNKELNYNSMDPNRVFKYIAPYFENIPNWSNPGTMINVIPPVNLTSLAATNIANMYNPNFAQDTYSGMLITAEMEVAKYLSDLLGWDWKKTHGTFTFGGKGTNLYATKVALNKIDKLSSNIGLERNKYFMITSKNGHPCHYEVCNWLGIGASNCYEIDCNENGQMNLELAEKIIDENINKGRYFIGYNLTAGSTNELLVDEIKKVYDMNKRIVKKYHLQYSPHIHADAVLGWVYLFFKKYNFEKNELNIETNILKKIKNMTEKVSELKYADSIGVDFHKTGFCPYVSSIVLFKNKEDYFTLCEADNIEIDNLDFGNYNPYHSTLELTRSSMGPLSALCSLKSLGVEGFQKIISNMFICTEHFRRQIKNNPKIELINEETEGLATLFIIKPNKYKDLNIKQIKNCSNEVIEEIKEYNVNFGKYILRLAVENKIHFIFTSSRSYKLPNSNIKIGALKSYPMSVHMTPELVENIVNEINKTIENYEKEKKTVEKYELSDNMVYR